MTVNKDKRSPSRGAPFLAPESCQRMIPKSGHRFSDQIMRN
jgi:hypothetical protein